MAKRNRRQNKKKRGGEKQKPEKKLEERATKDEGIEPCSESANNQSNDDCLSKDNLTLEAKQVQQHEKNNSNQDNANIASSEPMTTKTTVTVTEKDVLQGKNVSGRDWKTKVQKRASSLYKTKTNNLCRSWESKQLRKQQQRQIIELQKEMSEQKRSDILAKKERRLDNERRRAENEYKLIQKSGVQILNSNKIGTTLKAMSKKQLRMVKKTRMNNKTGVIEYVSAYAK